MSVPKVETFMTSHPYSIEISAHLHSAKTMMKQLGVRHLPVREGNTVVGVVAEKDIARAEFMGMDVTIGSDSLVKDVVDRTVFIVQHSEPLDAVLGHMAEHHIDVTVILKGERLAGIFTVTDACRCFAEHLRTEHSLSTTA